MFDLSKFVTFVGRKEIMQNIKHPSFATASLKKFCLISAKSV